ncbi:MAG: hypothetical protein HQM08_20610 [Candidatus Riflebacteria bacterium]|nr:hypothetical protein [Candidatus Riflebacteria bacterium]
MVHPEMIGITELLLDDRFLGWMEEQPENRLEHLSTYEIFYLFQNESENLDEII